MGIKMPPAVCPVTPLAPVHTNSGWLVILGPPGTGKTRRLLEHAVRELESGARAERIAIVTFTRAARGEILDRLGRVFALVPDALPWVRTVHAACFRLLGLRRGSVMTGKAWKAFGEKHGYDFSETRETTEDAPCEPPRQTADDLLRFALNWGRNRRLGIDSIVARAPVLVSGEALRHYVRRLEEFKRAEKLLDFPDLLERVITQGLRPDVDIGFIDEAQDLSPLQIAVVETWFGPCSRVYVAGDDDQALYGFQGAEPDWLLSLAREHPVEILEQSYRVPRVVHRIAERVIRQNRRRVPKSYRPASTEGEALSVEAEDATDVIDERTDTLVLARNRMFLAPIARSLFDRRVPYIVEGAGGMNPYGMAGAFEAVSAAQTLARGEAIPAAALCALLAFVPSRGVDLLPHGAKAKAGALEGVVATHVLRERLGLDAVLDRIAAEGPTSVLLKMRPPDREYFAALLRRHGEVPTPKVRLTSIHGAKGREADHVVVLPDMTRATFREYEDYSCGGNEAENRVAYVAVTRARERLVLVRPRTRRAYAYPTPERAEAVLA